MSDVVVIGSLNMDLVVKTQRMPAAGETIPGSDLQTIPGGKGANQAAAAAKLGCQVAMVGRVGKDAFGPRLLENLHRFGVNTSHVIEDEQSATGTAIIIVDQRGENSIVISAGANGKVCREDVDRAADVLSRTKYLLLQYEIPLDVVDYAIQTAWRQGVKVILNPAPASLLPPETLAKVYALVPNESETKLLTGMAINDLATAEKAARKLSELGIPLVIITLGERGALLVSADEAVHIPAKPVKAVDTTAAGDAFIGGLATALVKSLPLKEAVRYACCAGTLAVTRFGAQTSLPSAEEVQAFFDG